jgi:hypothetical protein
MRLIIFLIGLGLLVVGLSSYFGGIPLPISYGSSLIAIGAADFRADIVTVIFGVLLMLLSMAMSRPKIR